jgi:type IV pilus assembly protein PilA
MVKKLFKQFKYGQKGFTLIELLVVVAILGVLAAVAIPNVAKFIGTGDVAAAQTEAATVNTALGAYFADNHPLAAMDATAFSTAVTPYLNGVTTLKGTYTCDANGKITGTSYTGMTWSGGTWVKASS